MRAAEDTSVTLRVVAGKSKGRKLLSVSGDLTRPILDRVKTALFDILRPRLAEAVVLDMFAGTGQIGIEALSQGASYAIFTDISRKAIETIRENLRITELMAQSEVRHTDGFSYVRGTRKRFDFIFVAPPQYKGLWIEALRTIAERPERLTESGQVVVQIDPKEYEALKLCELREIDRRSYGNTMLVIYRNFQQLTQHQTD